MRRVVLLLVMIMGVFGLALILNQGEDNNYLIIYNAISILVICIMQMMKIIFKFSYRRVTFLQLICTLGFLYYGIIGIVLLIPILMFELFEENISVYSLIFINLLGTVIFMRENLLLPSIYIILINLYLNEVKSHEESREEIKILNKVTREQRFIMEEKMKNLNKYLEQNNLMTTLKERNFMAQKLHDHLGHRITSSIMQLEVTKETLGKDVELSEKYLVSAMKNLREGMDEIRKVLRNVKPRDRVVGLEDIKEDILKFQYDSGINTSLKVEGDINRIKLNQLTAIETNIIEALTNAAKYSKATEIKIFIYIYNKIARVEIRDNGVGCNSIHKGLGLKGIEERMEAINGRTEFNNDNGFIINMIVSLEEI